MNQLWILGSILLPATADDGPCLLTVTGNRTDRSSRLAWGVPPTDDSESLHGPTSTRFPLRRTQRRAAPNRSEPIGKSTLQWLKHAEKGPGCPAKVPRGFWQPGASNIFKRVGWPLVGRSDNANLLLGEFWPTGAYLFPESIAPVSLPKCSERDLPQMPNNR